jgi:hypothetical protein
MNTTAPGAESRGLTLNDVLNVLWRRRAFIVTLSLLGALAGLLYGWLVTPLHIASATLQPGITTFNDRGLAERGWEVQDIVQWYKRGDFNPTLAEFLHENPRRFRPIIRASHIPRTPQSRGGNTITITTLSPDPELARRVLRTSVEVFNAFAGGDTLTSDIHLMRVRIRANIEKQRMKIQQMEAEKERVELQIAKLKEERKTSQASKKLVTTRIEELTAARNLAQVSLDAYRTMIESGREGVDALRDRIDQWEEMEKNLLARRDELQKRTQASETTEFLLFSNTVSTLVQDIGDLRLGVFDESARLLEWQDRAAQLERDVKSLGKDIETAEFERDQTIPEHIFDLDKQIRDLELRRDFDLVRDEDDHRQELRAMESRLASLIPLELIGEPVASARPVRPRKPRAFGILFALGFVSSIFLAFTLEYLSQNWREITRPKIPV